MRRPSHFDRHRLRDAVLGTGVAALLLGIGALASALWAFATGLTVSVVAGCGRGGAGWRAVVSDRDTLDGAAFAGHAPWPSGPGCLTAGELADLRASLITGVHRVSVHPDRPARSVLHASCFPLSGVVVALGMAFGMVVLSFRVLRSIVAQVDAARRRPFDLRAALARRTAVDRAVRRPHDPPPPPPARPRAPG